MGNRQSVESLLYEGGEGISDHLELLADMGQDFAASLDIEKTLMRAIDRITRHVGAAGGALFLLDEAGETLRCQASVGATEITGLTLKSDEGIVGRCVQENAGEIVRDVAADPNFQKSVDEQTGFTTLSILCAPMSVKDQRIGAIELVNKLGGDGLFAESDLHLLQSLSASAALAILNARMAKALVEQERVRRELELAAEIQRSLLPESRPGTYPVHGVNVPARTVSGDFYDFFPAGDGRICFNLGDVSGKGMNAALLMAKTASLYRCLGKTEHSPGRLLGRINEEIYETATRGMFVTMVGGIYDPASGLVRLANAGHEPPLHHAAGGGFRSLPANAPPLGIAPLPAGEEGVPEIELLLDGGALYLFTDGVTEGSVEDGSPLGVDGMKALIEENISLSAGERLQAVVGRLLREEEALHDDLTILAIDDSDQATRRAANGAGAGERILEFAFPSQAGQLKEVRGKVRDTARLCGFGADAVQDIVLAVDEACQNVIRHAYGGSAEGEIVLEICRAGDDLVFLLRDFAEPTDVTTVKPRDLDDVRPGGLGTHFMAEVMDRVEFLPPPEGGGNLLRMVKRIA